MSKGLPLTEFEKGQILQLNKTKTPICEIAKALKRSRQVIGNYISNPGAYGIKKSPGRPKKLSVKTRNYIIRKSKGKKITCNQIKGNLGLKVSKSTILRIIKDEGGTVRKKIMRKPKLQQIHKAKRLIFSGQYKDLGTKWREVVFSDEKKFNLDGPDGYNFYWAGIDTKEVVYSKRAMGGESIMVWACFDQSGKSKLAFIEGNIDSVKYQNILKTHLLPFINVPIKKTILFQQDNAKPHVSFSTKLWFENEKIPLMSWPPYSPDLNPMENLWAILSREVYSTNNEYASLNELKNALIKKWDEISPRILKSLVSSMESRIIQAIKNLGGSTKY